MDKLTLFDRDPKMDQKYKKIIRDLKFVDCRSYRLNFTDKSHRTSTNVEVNKSTYTKLGFS